MDNQDLKNILIDELGSMPLKNKKAITPDGNIPEKLLNKLILKNEKKRKYTRIMLFTLLILVITSFILIYFFEVDKLSFMLFSIILLAQIPQLIFHPDYKNHSKKELVYKLFHELNKADSKSV
jgi:hypothetical protein